MNNDNKLSDFLKIAYKYNKVRNIEEAFEEYSVEEEWHKGKVENVLKEKNESYDICNIGDIVFVSKYLYKDGQTGENHFFVIIDKNNMAVPIENFGMLISSKTYKIRYSANKLLKKDDKNGLHKDSIVKTDIIYKILDEQILFKIGTVDKAKIEEYKEAFLESINNKN